MSKKSVIFDFPLKSTDTVVLGCSGGPDSMALLDLLNQQHKEIGFSLVIAHVDHNVRRESQKEKEFLEQYCAKLGLTFEFMKIEKYGDDNFHNEARTIRYQFFEQIVKKYHAQYLMTAHHADDLMETILMRISRGSTLYGYTGFHYCVDKGDYQLVRPLISYTKDELLEYDRIRKVPYCLDQSNTKDQYTRNRYRKVVLPFFKKEDPAIHQKFLKFSQVLSRADEYIQGQVDKVKKKVYHHPVLDIQVYQEIDPFLQEQLLYAILSEIYQDDLVLICDQHVKLLQDCIRSRKANVKVYLPNEVIAHKKYDQLFIEKEVSEVTSYEIELDQFVYLPNKMKLERLDETNENGNDICRLLSNEIVLPLIVRTRKLGDRMTLKGMNGTRKIKDIFIDRKISDSDRDLWPILTDASGKILWVPGLKKSKFDKKKSESYDIIIKCHLKEEKR